jgi:DNA-binding GntR family transcriptional regulator
MLDGDWSSDVCSSDLYDFRDAMERAVMRSVAPRLTAADLASLDEILIRESEAIARRDRRGYLALDREFHLCLANFTRNPYLIEALEKVRDLVDWMGMQALTRPERMVEVNLEHQRVLERLRAGDEAGAEAMMAEHIAVTRQNVLDFYRSRTADQ